VALAVVWTTLGKVMDVMPEVIIGAAIDVVVRGQDSFVAGLFGLQDRWQQIVALVILNGFVWFFESLFGYLSALAWRNLSQTIEHEIRTGLYRHVQGLDIAYFEDASSGGLLSIINDDVNQLERFLDNGAASILNVFWNIVLVGAVFAASSWLITLLAMLPIPFIVWGSVWYQKRLIPRYAGVREAVAELSSALTTNLSGIATIQAFTAEEGEAERIGRVSSEYRDANRQAIRFSAAFVPLIRMCILAGFTMTLLVGGWLTIRGALEVGTFSVLVFMTQRLLWPMTGLGETLDQLQRAMASTGRIFGLMDTRPLMADGAAAIRQKVDSEIALEDVTFGYGEGSDILKGVTIRVPAGQNHAIVGATGAGQ
jgi:ATP-binding cassette subfamily B protein